MIRTNLVPHPYFNVKDPEFYKIQKAQFELNRQKYKLVNQIRSGQQQEVLQQQIQIVKAKQDAVDELKKQKDIELQFDLSKEGAKVYSDELPVAVPPVAAPPAPAPPVAAPPVAAPARPVLKREAKPKAEPVEEKGKPLSKSTIKELKETFQTKYGDLAKETETLSLKQTLNKKQLTTLLEDLQNKTSEEIKQYLKNKKTEKKLEGRFEELKKPVAVAEEEPIAVPVAGAPPKRKGVSLEALTKSKRRLKKSTPKPKMKKASSAPPLTQSDVLKRALEARRGIIASSESESEFDGNGISKKQKRILYRGSAMAGNNNKALLKKIMKI